MDALPNEEILYKIADFWFVRSALQTVVFNKLYFEKTRFHQCGNFIVADDVDLIKVDSLDQYVKEVMNFPDNRNLLFRGHTNINYSRKRFWRVLE